MMDENIKAKLAAAGKIGLGGARMVSGVMTATGHGLVGAYLNQHHHMGAAYHIGKSSLEKGQKMVDEGLDDWKKASE